MALRVLANTHFPCKSRANFRAVWLLTVVLRTYELSFRRALESSLEEEAPNRTKCPLVCKRCAILDQQTPT